MPGDTGFAGGFGGPVIQPMMANGFGPGAVAGQTAVAQAGLPGAQVGQAAFADSAESQEVALNPAEQSALERIEKNLTQGLLTDVSKAELQEINQILSQLTPEETNNVIANLSDDQLHTWGRELDGWRGGLSDAEQVELYNSLAPDLDAKQLSRVYDAFGGDAGAERRLEFIENAQREAVEKIEVPEGLDEEQKELYLDLAQMSLDIVGIVDPTPISDGSNTLISLFRGKWIDAGLSAISIVPYVGDLAKLGKLGKWAETISNTVEMAAKNSEFAEAVGPVLGKIGDTIDSIPEGVFNKLPDSAQETLGAVKSKIDIQKGRAVSAITRNATNGENTVTWTTDSQGRVIEARATLSEVFPGLKRGNNEVSAQERIASAGVDGDHGGHIVAHRFVGDQGDINMFPQNGVADVKIDPGTGAVEKLKNFNGSAYKTMENEIADWVEAGGTVDFKVRFSDFDGVRPNKVYYDYIVKDPEGNVVRHARDSFENKAGETFNRVPKATIQKLLR